MSQFYITTAIDYPNGAPHMGHAYEKIVTDLYARWARLRGDRTWFLTGTDENGQKLVKAAQEAGMPTREYVDKHADLFRKLCSDLAISNDDFIRTTEKRHLETAQEIWKKLEKKGDIYFGSYSGLYCLACEAFYTETQSPDGKCPTHGGVLDTVKEEGYFFKLGSYSDWIKKYIQENRECIVPEGSRNEMLRRIDAEPVKDLSISRPNTGWGIPVPSNDKYVMYTWFDALINYISPFLKTLGEAENFWPADLHVIGKDITWFHTVIWPCVLKAADLPLPKQVYVHGMILGEDGRKMSKSLGNGVDPKTIIENYPIESFRYYLLRAIPSGGDGAFVTADMIARHNSELANDYGNLLMRIVKFVLKKTGPQMDSSAVTAAFDFTVLGKQMNELMNRREHHHALEILWKEIGRVNVYVTEKAPWKMEVSNPEFKTVVYNALYGIHCFATLLQPFMPKISAETLKYLGTSAHANFEGLKFGVHQFEMTEPVVLFPKFETKK